MTQGTLLRFFFLVSVGTTVIVIVFQNGKRQDSFSGTAIRQNDNQHRLEQLKAACANFTATRKGTKQPDRHYYYSKNYNFSYCYLRKVGSTFMTRAFRLLNNQDQKNRQELLELIRENYRPLSNDLDIPFSEIQTQKPRTLLVVRNPYTRLYSGYMDRVLLRFCNPPTFKEFVESLPRGYIANSHFDSVTSLCSPCDIDVDYVVRFENFGEEMEYVLRDLGVNGDTYDVLVESLNEKRGETLLPALIENRFKSVNKRCQLRSREIAKRIWREMQVMGYIDITKRLPKSISGHTLSINGSYLANIILREIKTYPLEEGRKLEQREKFVSYAYESVGNAAIRTVQELFYSDFQLFGYDMQPPIIKY